MQANYNSLFATHHNLWHAMRRKLNKAVNSFLFNLILNGQFLSLTSFLAWLYAIVDSVVPDQPAQSDLKASLDE